MRNESWLRLMSGLVLVGIFAAGALFGAGLMRFAAPTAPVRPPLPPGGPGPIEAIKHQLGLDADQIAALDQIAAAHHGELDAIGREAQMNARRVLFAIEDELAPKLRPEQVEALAQWRKTRRPPPGGPLGPGGPPPRRPPPGGPMGPGGPPSPGGPPPQGGPMEPGGPPPTLR